MAEATAVAVAEAEAITEARPPARSSARSTCASASVAAVEVAPTTAVMGLGGGDSGGRGGGGADDGGDGGGDNGGRGGGGGSVEPVHTDAPDGAPPSGNAKLHSTPSQDDGVERSARILSWNSDLRFPDVERKPYKAMSAFCRVFVRLVLSMQRSDASAKP
jgi:hypothetical protein